MPIPTIAHVREALIAEPGKAFDLSKCDTRGENLFDDKKSAETSLKKDAAVIDELQDKLYANGKKSLLLVLQGMDTSGKSGTIKSVFANTSPLGMQVTAFKAPTPEELAHDYLWRIHKTAPPRGYIGVFDRSHYEDVLIVKVRGFAAPEAIEQRYEQINAFEKLLVENGTVIVKCMLNISYDEQGERLKQRLDEAHKTWKFNPGDLEDRKDWKAYMAAYEMAVLRCSTPHAPWYVVPSDSRTRRNAAIARLVRGALEDLSLEWPKSEHKAEDFDIS
jgi:PPK2 family polyphosphate:nucleotide phosphotransferase